MAFRPRTEILPTAQRALWPALGLAAGLGFVLYGGTAIALRLAHRASIDFDLFTDRDLDRRSLDAAFPFIARAVVLQDRPDTLTVLAGTEGGEASVKISFFGGLGFGRVGAPDTTDDGVLQVASLDDLMATKLKVLLQRVEAKDYIDVAAMIRAGAGLARALAGAEALYGPAFQPAECLKALVWFEGGDLDALSRADRTTLAAAAAAVRELPSVSVVSRRLAA